MKKLLLATLAALVLGGGMAWAAHVGDGSNWQPAPYHYGIGGG